MPLNYVPGAYARRLPLSGTPNVAINSVIPAFVAKSRGANTIITAEAVVKGATDSEDVLANSPVRIVSRVSNSETGVADFQETTHYNLTASGIDWSPTAVLPPPELQTPIVSNAGGTLASGTWYFVITARNGNGETTQSNMGTAVASGGSSQVVLNWGAVPNATSYRVFRTQTLSAGSPDFSVIGAGLLATVSGGTTTTYTDDGGTVTTPATDPPVTNSAADEPTAAATYYVDYEYAAFTFNTPVLYTSLDDVKTDHGKGSEASVMAEFAMSTVRGNAAPSVYIVAPTIDTDTEADPTIAQYQTALEALNIVRDEVAVVVGLYSTTLQTSLKTHINFNSQEEEKRFRIGIAFSQSGMSIGSTATLGTMLYQANSLSDRRMLYVAMDGGGPATGFVQGTDGVYAEASLDNKYVAAALAGLLSSLPDTATPLTRQTIAGFTGLASGIVEYNDTELKQLRDGGVLAIDKVGNDFRVFQGRTTEVGTTQEDAEPSIVLADDTVARVWINAVDRFVGRKLTPGLLNAVEVATRVALDSLVTDAIINSYDDNSVVVIQDATQLDLVRVSWTYDPIFPSNIILAEYGFTVSA